MALIFRSHKEEGATIINKDPKDTSLHSYTLTHALSLLKFRVQNGWVQNYINLLLYLHPTLKKNAITPRGGLGWLGAVLYFFFKCECVTCPKTTRGVLG